MTDCIECQTSLQKSQRVYCSIACQKEYFYRRYIDEWKKGSVSGNRGVSAKAISRHVRRYLLEKFQYACSVCKWCERNNFTGIIPLEVDHIDGNADNNVESNLRILCPNCHSLTANFRNLNRGKGRAWRRDKYIKIGT